jgi:predicted transcriptional regulator YdeE
MNRQLVSGFYVAGLWGRTNNAAEYSKHGKIGQLWGQFLKSDFRRSLPNRIGDEVYAVYTDYESDHTGDYTFVVGHRVSTATDLGNRFVTVQIPDGEYAVITSELGPAAQIVPAVWQKISALTPEELSGIRSYRCDFELYDHRSQNPNLAQIDVFLGLQGPGSLRRA